ncbi:MAG TPA: hypothetical protein VM802_11375 [Chitinophaga sp.]|uniref:hypothetical protein n=1 Tax=Chitinophaga sp. TaxID=1869181 RepID=UPI002BFD77C1|nr:hypothetical protein [Chitinophaga sp.]HVI45466.1 hypothetical protein [Chitinophaga sp.]
MDKLLIQEIEDYIAVSRIRTERRRKRAVKEQADKDLLQLSRLRTKQWHTWHNRGFEPLIPPIMNGYIRSFVLREDVARGKQADFYQEVLNKINTYDHSHRRDFRIRRRSRGKKIYVVKPQQLLQPTYEHFAKLKFSEAEALCFEEREMPDSKDCSKSTIRLVFKEPWRFVLSVRPYMITERRVALPDLQSEIDKLRSYIDGRNLQHRIWKLTRGKRSSRRSWLTFPKPKEYFRFRTLLQTLEAEWYGEND